MTRHKVAAVACWRLDRLGRNLRHLVLLLDEWQARGVAFVTLGEGIDTTTPAARLVAGVLASIAEFERARIQERVHAGLARDRRRGTRLGRPRKTAASTTLTVREAARLWNVSPATAARRLARGLAPETNPSDEGRTFAAELRVEGGAAGA